MSKKKRIAIAIFKNRTRNILLALEELGGGSYRVPVEVEPIHVAIPLFTAALESALHAIVDVADVTLPRERERAAHRE